MTSAAAACAALLFLLPAGDPLTGFRERVKAYAALHQRLSKDVPPLKDKTNPAAITTHEQALAAALRKARSEAQPGDILTPDAVAEIRKVLRAEMKGPGNADTRAAARVGNPKLDPEGANPVLRINATYPNAAPLSLMPPTVLERLPELPPVLEYRLVGRTLILRDTVANIIVDYAKEVTPAL